MAQAARAQRPPGTEGEDDRASAAEADASTDVEADGPETGPPGGRPGSKWDDRREQSSQAAPSEESEMFQALIDAGHPSHVYEEMERVYAFFNIEEALLPG